MIHSLNDNEGFVMAVLTAVYVVATIVLVTFSQTVPELWRTGLIDALSRLRTFTDASPTEVDRRVMILEFRVPRTGASMTTELMARYKICDRASGAILFSAEISSRYTVPFNYSLDGTVRATESINRAVQANISKLLERLSSAALPHHLQTMNSAATR